MNYAEKRYEVLLERAWKATYDAFEMAENQGRRQARRRLQHAVNLINAAQADVVATERVARDRFEAQLARLQGRGDDATDC